MPLKHIVGVIMAAWAAVAWWELANPDAVRTAYRAAGWRGVLVVILVPVGITTVAYLLMVGK